MKANSISTFVLILALLAQFVIAVDVVTAYDDPKTNPICPTAGLLLERKDLTASAPTTLTFDYSSTYFTINGDSAPLLVRKPAGASGYKFLYPTDNIFSSFTEKECTGTSTYTFVDLVGRLLILKDGSIYKVCTFKSFSYMINVDVITLAAFPVDKVTGAITSFIPYHSTEQLNLHIVISDGTNSAVYSYVTLGATPGTPSPSTGFLIAGKAYTSFYGTSLSYFQPSENRIKKIADGTQVLALTGSNPVLSLHRLRGANGILSTMNTDKKTGKLIYMKGDVATELTYADATTTEFREFSDSLNNMVRLGSTSFFWFSVKADTSAYYTATVPLTAISTGATGSIMSFGLSGDKAVILYTNKAVHLKITADNTVKKIYETTSAGIVLPADTQLVLSLKCMCEAIINTTCFSSTLACLVIKVASTQTCSTKDQFIAGGGMGMGP